uniref:Uncharacterized 3.7 kDa protein in psbV-trnM intergenic region n=1 Tax=Trieres chinensis TaxID=1514140 RepID=YCXC_TRICV|nr:ORF29b [Trieres chinensis]P49838.1 RecName: Full=Uncharacterized 3.7 kDa protein in psbV-trnM intergenic region; AltName: Full=ORF29B [Trieres chinensis]CAA91733.1 ORF29b [Trieres chinensis]
MLYPLSYMLLWTDSIVEQYKKFYLFRFDL